MKEIIPYEVKVSIYGMLIILVSIFVFFKKKELDQSFFKKYYIYYYIIFIANLFNMMFVTSFYHFKKNDMIGLPGIKGGQGEKGDMGKKVSCYDSNLNIKKTKLYREILRLDVGEEELGHDYKDFKNYIENGEKYFNLEFLNNINNQDRLDMDKEYDSKMLNILHKIFKKETRMNILFYYLNKRITNDKRKKKTKLGFYRPIGGNGFFPMGHSVFDVTESDDPDLQIKMNAFIINGDIRFPTEYDIKMNFTNKDILERQDKRKDIDEDEIENNGLNRTNKDKPMVERTYSILYKESLKKKDADGKEQIYVPMGELIVRNEDANEDKKKNKYIPEVNLMGFINEKCAKQIDLSELELVGVKMSFKSHNEIRKFFRTEPDQFDTEDLGLFSIWKTPMNTFVTNCIKEEDNDLTDNTVGFYILDGVQNQFLNGNYTTTSGNNYIKTMLKAIEIPILIRICYVSIYQHIIYFEELKYYIPKKIEEITSIINDNLYRIKRASVEKKKKIEELNKKLKKKNKRFTKLARLLEEKKINDYTTFTSLFDGDGTDINNNSNNSDNMQPLLEELPDYNKMKEKLNMIPSIINEKKNLYDLLTLIFPNGFDTNVNISKLNFIEKEILKICKICFPPNTKIYIPKNECISYETIDLVKRKLYRKLDKVLSRFNFLKLNYEFDLSQKNYESNCDSYEKTSKKILELEDKFENNFGHIKNYKTLIKNQDMELFSNPRIELIIEEYEKVIKHFEESCNKVEFKDYFDENESS